MTPRRDRIVLRTAHRLVAFASRGLPADERAEWQHEWVAELPVILHDPDGGTWWRRAARTLGFALDQLRGAPRIAGAYWWGATGRAAFTLGIATVGAVLLLVSPTFIGGVRYMFSGGEQAEISRSKNMMIRSVLWMSPAHCVTLALFGVGPMLIVMSAFAGLNLLVWLAGVVLARTGRRRPRRALEVSR